MYNWKTNDVVDLLNQTPDVKKAEATWPGGDHDTRQVVVEFFGTSDRLFISGYYSTEECISDPDNSPVEWVCISDGKDSRGGLQSFGDDIVSVYHIVRKHFLKGGASSIIGHYSEIF